jgi:4'-phosphopantetheinyl transferase
MLGPNQIHVWRVPLNLNPHRIPELKALLSTEERDRAERFHFEKDRNQFIESRCVLRQLLGQYLDVAPEDLTCTQSAYGKSALASGDLRFNLSRRDGLALIAVTRSREIGVDVELVRPDLDLFGMAGVSFSENEFASLKALPKSEHAPGFYNCWTRKEAFVKAVGEGFSFPLKQFDVSLTPGEPARLIAVHRKDPAADPIAAAARWFLQEIAVPDGYVAALAYEAPEVIVTCIDWASS